MITNVYAVVPSRNRPVELAALLNSLELPAEQVLVIDNASSPPLEGLNVLRDLEQPPNISRLWNLGLDWAARQANGTDYAVAVLNDDVVLPPGFLDAMTEAIERTGAAIAFPSQRGSTTELHRTAPGPVPRDERMTGYAFVVRGSAGLRADESLRWWCGDDDLEWNALRRGGTVLVPVTVQHLHPGVSTDANPELELQTRLDMAAFEAKWGMRPWN